MNKVKQVKYNKLDEKEKKEVLSLLEESNKDQFLKNYFDIKDFDNYKSGIVSIITIEEDQLVGFYKPRKVTSGDYKDYYRSGPIFIKPKYRGKGYAKEALDDYFENKKGMCWISDKNTNSQRLYKSIGFKKSNKHYLDPDENEMGTFWFKD